MLATLTHISDLTLYSHQKPYKLYGFSENHSNCEYTDYDQIEIADVRGRENDFQLDECGFTFALHCLNCLPQAEVFETATAGDEAVTAFLKETISFAKTYFRASRVLCIDWRLRKHTPTAISGVKNEITENIRQKALAPVQNMHCDYSDEGGKARLSMHLLPEEISRLEASKERVQFINVWRPLKLVQSAPLVLCDRRSISAEDLLPVDQVLPTKAEEGLLLKHRKHHKWFWYSEQCPNEITLFQTWDSLADKSVVNYPPHGASLKTPAIEDAPPRESVEVRLIVITPYPGR